MTHTAFITHIKTLQTEWPEEAKDSHSTVHYTLHTKDMSEQCQGCRNFIQPNRCRTVVSPISITGYCDRFRRAL